MVAALFVETNGVYFGLPDVDPWDRHRDARPTPARIRWSRIRRASDGAATGAALHGRRATRLKKGDDSGLLRRCLGGRAPLGRHPGASRGEPRMAALRPQRPSPRGGWVVADFLGGWTCCIEQGHYGHRARKATWLYAHGIDLPSLRWGPRPAILSGWTKASIRKRNAPARSRPARVSGYRNASAPCDRQRRFRRLRQDGFSVSAEREQRHCEKCLFVTVPDVVGSARRTLEVFEHWKPKLVPRRTGALTHPMGKHRRSIHWRLDRLEVLPARRADHPSRESDGQIRSRRPRQSS
jgi:hypothetical protein